MFWPRAGRISRVILVAVVVVYFAGIYCTLTRVVWLAAGIGTLAALVVALPRRQGLTFLAAAALLGCALLAAKWNDLNAFKRDRYVSVAEMSQSATLRPVLAYIALQMYVEHPIAGCGYHQYADSSRYYLGDRSTHLRLERGRGFVQHNVFLSLLVETGMIGAGLFLLWLMVVTAAGWQLWCSPTNHLAYRQTGLMVVLMVMSYAIMGMFHDLALIPMVNTLLFFMAGVLRSASSLTGCSHSAIDRDAAGRFGWKFVCAGRLTPCHPIARISTDERGCVLNDRQATQARCSRVHEHHAGPHRVVLYRSPATHGDRERAQVQIVR